MKPGNYREIKPGSKRMKRLYVAVMLFFVGRAIQAAARVDKTVKKEFDGLRKDFAFSMGVFPNGPFMVLGKDEKGNIRYRGWKPEKHALTLKLFIKNIEAAMLVFTFQESTAVAFSHNRFIVDGNLADGLAVVRVLDAVEVYLLPKIIAKMAIKRYPTWSELNPLKKHVNRIIIYTRALLGF